MLRAEELGYYPEKVAEYDAAAPCRRAARRGDPDAAPSVDAPPAPGPVSNAGQEGEHEV